MTAPLEGIRVLEVANWLAAPSAAALMADLGADVVKVEPPGGDPYRGFNFRAAGYDFDFAMNYAFELDNRGKRSITVALDQPGGPELVRRLAAGFDVFITNLFAERRARFGLAYEDIRMVNPRVVYGSFSGYGMVGPDANRPGFDYAAFWARSGIMSLMGAAGTPPALCRGGQGDHTACLALLSGILAALRVRDQVGEGQLVDVTLHGTGIWTLGTDLQMALVSKESPPRHDRTAPVNPLWNMYETRDGRWILLAMPASDPYWPSLCRAAGRPEWVEDSRYDGMLKRKEHTRELTAALTAIFAAQDADYWAAKLDEAGVIWAPVLSLTEVIDDPQARATGAFTTIEHPVHGAFETMAPPFRLPGAVVGPKAAAPSPGEHTAAVLQAAGIREDEVANLAAAGVFG
jgi:crotonobetainyl-CoA:carnitine CoA-transferase CaiB-like acyl-CoA transferase